MGGRAENSFRVIIGNPSSHDIQIPRWVRLNDASLPSHHQKNLDESAAVGRVHPVRQSYCTGELWGAFAAPQGPAARASR